MAQNFRQNRVSNTEINTEQEIWNTIRYLDPDGELRKSDILLGVIWTLVFALLGVFIFLLNH